MGRSQRRLPAPILPMLATAGSVLTGAGWAFEFKWDGVRAVTSVGGGQVHVISRNNNDVTRTYPELAALAPVLSEHAAVLDGEIVALDQSGRARFDLLQLRMHVQRPTETLLDQVPVTYVLFDLLHLDGDTLIEQPYQRRRELLDGLDLDGRVPGVRAPAYVTDTDGTQLLDVARAHHLEGIVAKRMTSRYEPGRRSRAWIKTPSVRPRSFPFDAAISSCTSTCHYRILSCLHQVSYTAQWATASMLLRPNTPSWRRLLSTGVGLGRWASRLAWISSR